MTVAASGANDRLRLSVFGRPDDGKRTLVGRLFGESGGRLADPPGTSFAQAVGRGAPDRHFATAQRRFTVVDAPGHVPSTPGMATAASAVELAVLLVDVRAGVLPQTRADGYLVNQLGLRQVILAVNKMDLVGYRQAEFDRIAADFQALAAALGLAHCTAVPLSARQGDNVIERSARMPWYGGPSLLQQLEAAEVAGGAPVRRAPGLQVDKAARRRINGHGSAVVWLTGLSGAGKSTIAHLLEQRLHALGVRTYLLDGDNLRHGLNQDLGFTAPDRVENVRRVAEVARLMVDAGVVVIAALISPFRNERRLARALLAEGEFVEVFVDTPLALAEQRDPKGLYAKARRGALKNFTGIDSPYEAPDSPEIVLDTTRIEPEHAAERLLMALNDLHVITVSRPERLRGPTPPTNARIG